MREPNNITAVIKLVTVALVALMLLVRVVSRVVKCGRRK